MTRAESHARLSAGERGFIVDGRSIALAHDLADPRNRPYLHLVEVAGWPSSDQEGHAYVQRVIKPADRRDRPFLSGIMSAVATRRVITIPELREVAYINDLTGFAGPEEAAFDRETMNSSHHMLPSLWLTDLLTTQDCPAAH